MNPLDAYLGMLGAEVIGEFTPKRIEALLVVRTSNGVETHAHGIELKGPPVFWPPQRWAIAPEYDYILIRVPRK